jgi:uncharacterized membrane protein SpoIIM required for sporulation
MNEREFASKKRRDWDKLASIVARANRISGVRSLSHDDILALAPLYRRVSSDLSRARTHDANSDLIAHLNGLVGQAHALLYEAETAARPLHAVYNFYLYEFPAVLQRRWKAFFCAFAITLFGAVFAYWLVITQPSNTDLFIPAEFRKSVDVWKSKNVSETAHLEQSGMLMTNNLQVGLTACALGIALVPDATLLFTNGATLGAISAIMTQVHGHSTFWPGILPHGIAELTAIFICGGAGFVLAMALILPAPYSRQDALRLAATDAVKMVLGTIPLFIFAGMIEGMFSHLDTTAAFRYTFAGATGIAWYLYLFLPRGRLRDLTANRSSRNSLSPGIVTP